MATEIRSYISVELLLDLEPHLLIKVDGRRELTAALREQLSHLGLGGCQLLAQPLELLEPRSLARLLTLRHPCV
jgi:hypothetical protein